MSKVRYAIALALALQAAPAAAQALWNGAGYGMHPAQVQARFPQAQVPDSPDELAGGESEGLRLEGVDVAGHRFRASFFFDGEALAQVTLSQQAPRAGRADLRVFEDVAGALQARHGAPAASEQRQEPFERRSHDWQVDGTRVALVLIESGTASFVNVIYQVRPPDAPPPVRLRSGG
jgi:hypothetical protein